MGVRNRSIARRRNSQPSVARPVQVSEAVTTSALLRAWCLSPILRATCNNGTAVHMPYWRPLPTTEHNVMQLVSHEATHRTPATRHLAVDIGNDEWLLRTDCSLEPRFFTVRGRCQLHSEKTAVNINVGVTNISVTGLSLLVLNSMAVTEGIITPEYANEPRICVCACV